jgi:long-chain acyl-CoA synthetase
MVVSGGVNIYPAESEQALQRHPAVVDVACIGVPDNEMGEQLIAVVQLQPGAVGSPELAAELDAFCKDALAGYKRPRAFRFTDALPRNAMGKLDKKALRAEHRGN